MSKFRTDIEAAISHPDSDLTIAFRLVTVVRHNLIEKRLVRPEYRIEIASVIDHLWEALEALKEIPRVEPPPIET